MNSRLKNALYVIVPLLVLVWVVGHEFFWRYESLDLTERIQLADHAGRPCTLVVRQTSSTKVDTARRTFVDMKQGLTQCSIWLEGSRDTFHTTAEGRYFSEFRTLKIATDSSLQAMLIPNSEHGLAPGWGSLVYLTPTDSLRVLQIINANIGDVDKDGAFELLDTAVRSWTKLEPASGKWVPITVKVQP
ncbi:MAG: hypothetical protein JSS75_10515 [Bacteroidetes bacterium]|nr:hypothetical protein [Bacteroidota bacterium]